MAGYIYGIEYQSVCDIASALEQPSVKMNDRGTYDGNALFEHCLSHGGFVKPPEDEDEICVWSGGRFDPYPVIYGGRRYAAFLLAVDRQTDGGWEEVPVSLVLLDESVLGD